MTGLSLQQIKEIFERRMLKEASFDSFMADQELGDESAPVGGNEADPYSGMSGRTPAESKVEDKVYELIDALDAMGKSNPDLADAYISLFRAMKDAGVSVERVAMMAEGKKG